MDAPAPGTLYNPFLYGADTATLEKWLLIAVCVAGKVARPQEAKLNQLMAEQLRCYRRDKPPGHVEAPSPFELVRYAVSCHANLRQELEVVRMGQYTRIEKAFRKLAFGKLDLRTCTREDLVAIPGIGMKTASFFILFSRQNVRIACLDTHILAWLRENGHPTAPRSTPAGRAYGVWEAVFIEHCDRLERNIAELDFEIWKARNRGDKR